MKLAYPDLNKEQRYKKGQELWKKLRTILKKAHLNIDAMITKRKSKTRKMWLNFLHLCQKKENKKIKIMKTTELKWKCKSTQRTSQNEKNVEKESQPEEPKSLNQKEKHQHRRIV